jgi:hypothetical protein
MNTVGMIWMPESNSTVCIRTWYTTTYKDLITGNEL